MFPSEIEVHYLTDRHPNGGVAPSRHALAQHVYNERRNGWTTARSAGPLSTALGGMLSVLVTSVRALFSRLFSFSPKEGQRSG